jgi:hypothetical protein
MLKHETAERAVAPRQGRRSLPIECTEDEVAAVIADKAEQGLELVRRKTRVGKNGQPIAMLWFEASRPEIEFR